MKTLCPPYKDCKLSDISQVYGNIQPFDGKPHLAVDFCPPNGYGKLLIAPEDCQVATIVNSEDLAENLYPMNRGYGIVLRSLADPYRYYLYWHCLPIFPVVLDQIVKQGEFVAQMGNSGYCFQGGVFVPLAERPFSKRGCHLHYEMFTEKGGIRTYYNVLDYTDFNLKITTNFIEVIRKLLEKLLNIK